MVTDHQYRRLKKLIHTERTKVIAASKAGMDVKTARKYLGSDIPPSELKKPHTWRTRKDPFEEDWPEIKQKLGVNTGFEAKVLFEYLQRSYPGKYEDGQLRTLQRYVKVWRSKAILTFDYEWLKEELLVEEKFKTKLHGKITHEAVL